MLRGPELASTLCWTAKEWASLCGLTEQAFKDRIVRSKPGSGNPYGKVCRTMDVLRFAAPETGIRQCGDVYSFNPCGYPGGCFADLLRPPGDARGRVKSCDRYARQHNTSFNRGLKQGKPNRGSIEACCRATDTLFDFGQGAKGQALNMTSPPPRRTTVATNALRK